MIKNTKINRTFLIWTIVLAISGFIIFCSASLGILAKNEQKFSNIAFNQLVFGLFLGSLGCLIASKIDYKHLKKYALIIFIFSIFITILVFFPKIGMSHGGASRWINLKFITFQPAEILKIGFIIYLSAWLSTFKNKISTLRWGLLPFVIFSSIIGVILLLQPDTDTFAVAMFAGLAMYIVAGAKWRHILTIFLVGLLAFSMLVIMRPYIRERIKSMWSPSSNTKTTSYQLNQSLIAVGSGKIWGKGFGQSAQKFNYLPEPVGDSVFAVAAEEFGFLGATIIVGIFTAFCLSGLKIASATQDDFGRLLIVGIVILIVSQAFINICGMLGLLPLMGIPLPFISHGGTSLFITLVEAGIIMNISKNTRLNTKK